MEKVKPLKFSCDICSLEPVSNLISKARLRLFYLGMNRNGGYITQNFAENYLLPSLPYTPVIGDYSEEEGDFTTHRERNVARAYGVVPQDPNLTWEPYLDIDGVERVYATIDVFLWTGRFDQANEIVGKPHSLELNPKTITGRWQYVENGRKAYIYETAEFLGLSVLGMNVEPCFEGSAFFELISQFNLFMIDKEEPTKKEESKGGKKMVNYRLENDEKYKSLFLALNPNFNEENPSYEFEIATIAEDYVIAYDCKENKFSKVPYTYSEEEGYVFGEKEEGSLVLATEAMVNEYSETQAKVEELNGALVEKDATIESINASLVEKDGEIELQKNSIADFEQKIVEFETNKTTVELEMEKIKTEKTEAEAQYALVLKEKNDLELSIKQDVVKKFEKKVSSEVIDDINAKLSDFSIVDLKKELAFFAYEQNPGFLDENPQYVPTGADSSNPSNGIISILERYKNK